MAFINPADVVRVSGQTLLIGGSLAVSVSGQVVQISGQGLSTSVSGNIIQISGQAVTVGTISVSGNVVQISGQSVTTSVSGNVVQVSGQPVQIWGSQSDKRADVAGNVVAAYFGTGGGSPSRPGMITVAAVHGTPATQDATFPVSVTSGESAVYLHVLQMPDSLVGTGMFTFASGAAQNSVSLIALSPPVFRAPQTYYAVSVFHNALSSAIQMRVNEIRQFGDGVVRRPEVTRFTASAGVSGQVQVVQGMFAGGTTGEIAAVLSAGAAVESITGLVTVVRL